MKTNNIYFAKVTNFKNVFLGAKFNAYVAVNEKGQFGHLPNELTPYVPIGGIKTLKNVINILVFK